MNVRPVVYRFPASFLLPLLWGAFLLFCPFRGLKGQVDLLPLDHPATSVLERLYYYGAIPDFPVEHLPLSRRSALEFLERAIRDTTLPENLRRQAEWRRAELAADAGEAPRSVVIPTRDESLTIFDDPFANRPFTGLDYFDSATRSSVALDPILEGEFRHDAELGESAAIVQGGARLRGTALGRLGFSGRVTNGTILGADTVILLDPRFGRSFKFGVVRQNRDVDFGGGHVRGDFDVAAAEIGREPLRLGNGGEGTLLLGGALPSSFDYLRFQMRLGPVSFSHVHASLLADPTGASVGITAEIPQKYVATHLLTLGPVAGIRLSLGEAVIYSGRGFEVGYLNPLNFMKSQEHFLRDRDNTYMYVAASVAPARRVFLEGEFLLDDLIFSRIGEGYWGNKTAWRIGGRLTAFPLDFADLSASYTRLEPYVYSHFNPTNAYLHDGAMLAASGLEPNSYLLDLGLSLFPAANLTVRLNAGTGEHGANETENGQVVRNVGGDVRRTFDTLSVSDVRFLDGTVEHLLNLSAAFEYEVLRGLYVQGRVFRRTVTVEDEERENVTQFWLGVRVGAK